MRELGVADLGVGRRIKIMTEALNGRIQAYDQGFDAGEDTLRDAIRRNVYGTVNVHDAQVSAMAAYLRALRDALAATPIAELRAARVQLPQPVAPTADEVGDAPG
jgi:cytochrome b pre-mRNA-processing protein 3